MTHNFENSFETDLNIPPIVSREDLAIDLVVSVVNKATTSLGTRQTLYQLAKSRDVFGAAKVNLTSICNPVGYTSEDLIRNTIVRVWRLTDIFSYDLKYMGVSHNETSTFHYLEAQFSQPTIRCPIPQNTAKVYFRTQEDHMEKTENKKLPTVIFRLECHLDEHDIRYVKLTPDWIMAIMKMKLIVNQRIEKLQIF